MLSSNMFKFLVFCVLMWNEMSEISGSTENTLTDTPAPSFASIDSSKNNDNDTSRHSNGIYHFHGAHQTFYLNGPLLGRAGLISDPNSIGKEIRSDYFVTNGIGAHKLHSFPKPWFRARQICAEEGGHLAVIRTESEEKIVLQMMHEVSIGDAWLGFHDIFVEGDWITVLDEPLRQIGWAHWIYPNTNPDNFKGNQNCARIVKDGGMDDENCDSARPFFCKISTF